MQALRNAIVAAALLGCHQTVAVRASTRSNAVAPRSVTWEHYFLFGFIGEKTVDVRDYCEKGAVTVVSLSDDVATIAVTVATLGIYVPRRLTITCDESISP